MYVETLLLHLWFRCCGILQTELKPSKGGAERQREDVVHFQTPADLSSHHSRAKAYRALATYLLNLGENVS